MSKLILMNAGVQENRVALLKDEHLDEFFIERINERTIVGNIYKAKVGSIAPSLNAAFLDIGISKKGFLYLSEANKTTDFLEEEAVDFDNTRSVSQTKTFENLKVGQELIVQVVKEQIGTKGPRLTTKISLPGRYLVLLPREDNIGISRRIDEEEERKRLRSVMGSLSLPCDFGFVVRTVSVGAKARQLQRDAKFLLKLWKKISHRATRIKAPALIHEEFDLIVRIVRDSFSEDVDNLFIDSKKYFHIIRSFVRSYSPNLLGKIRFFKAKEPLFERFKIEEKIEDIFRRKVNLKSGGYIYIEPTEGLVAIDVNSGRFRAASQSAGPSSQEEMAFKVNMEAAYEIARQLKLRDLGGLIIIDFIDMARKSHRDEVYENFKRLLAFDRAKTDVIRISDFGILEMTRQKQRLSAESVSYQICPYCRGKGKVKSKATVSIMCLRMLNRALSSKEHSRKHKLLVSLHPEVVEVLNAEHQEDLKNLQARSRTTIILNPSPHLHLEKIIIE